MKEINQNDIIDKYKSSTYQKIQKFKEYILYIERHYENVQKAWELIKEKCKDGRKNGDYFRFIVDDYVYFSIVEDVLNHDLSKLSDKEFLQYRCAFYPTENEKKDKDGLAIASEKMQDAWEHHKKHNSHHWENWTQKQKNFPYADMYLVMMVIDWVAMSFEFGDTAKEYYEKNKDKIHLPDWAIELMYDIFDCIYTIDKE